jgi:NADH:ubiquinone oxidoreductase subunit 3 (subunit A)
MPDRIFVEDNAITSLLEGYVALVVIAAVVFIVLAMSYILNRMLKDSRQLHRKQVLKGYRKAEAHIRYKLKRSKMTGVLYSKGV